MGRRTKDVSTQPLEQWPCEYLLLVWMVSNFIDAGNGLGKFTVSDEAAELQVTEMIVEVPADSDYVSVVGTVKPSSKEVLPRFFGRAVR